MTEREYWILWNSLYRHVGSVKFNQLLKAFGSAKEAWEAPAEEFIKLGWNQKALHSLNKRKNTLVEPVLEKLSEVGAKVLTVEDEDYPERLRSIYDPPPLLYARGDVLPSDNLSLAVVGTRKMTRYGQEAIEALIPELCAAGLTIISGLALGTDAAAHRVALQAGGRTLAVLACGIDRIYPLSNSRLGEEIITRGKGAIVTEFPPETPTYPSNFPVRNRIISGLSLGTLVIEAAIGSGTFHTVRAALEQGREVFAVPGSIFSSFSSGTAKLIQSGAKPVTSAKDILEELEVETKTAIQKSQDSFPETKEEEDLLRFFDSEERSVDEIIESSNKSTNEVLSTLTILEMKGLIKSTGPSIYRKAS
jgi:DNA processing protein